MVVDINYGSLQAFIWIEATYPPGAERWESLALFASDISIPPVGKRKLQISKWHFLCTRSKPDSRLGQEGALALDETISRPSHCPFPPARCLEPPVRSVSGIPTSKRETSLSGISLPGVTA